MRDPGYKADPPSSPGTHRCLLTARESMPSKASAIWPRVGLGVDETEHSYGRRLALVWLEETYIDGYDVGHRREGGQPCSNLREEPCASNLLRLFEDSKLAAHSLASAKTRLVRRVASRRRRW